ncbi:MAG: signal peptidase I [Thermodesulfobacteriota bacterium]
MFIRRREEKKKKSLVREYLEALIWAVVLALIIRTWGVQAFKIPSGSMEPTLLVGDHLLVSKSSYGIKLPFTDQVIVPIGDPKRGDIIVFRFPEDRDLDFIKRIIGLPGETVQVKGKSIFINGQKLDERWGEYSGGQTHVDFGPIKVPAGQYFVMGDNRDNSRDSRLWFNGRGGFVPRRDILGKAFIIYWSWVGDSFDVRWRRLANLIH